MMGSDTVFRLPLSIVDYYDDYDCVTCLSIELLSGVEIEVL